MTRVLALFRHRHAVWAAAAVAVVAAFVFVFFVLPPLLVPSDVGATEAERMRLRNDVRSAATQFLGGLALLTGLLFTARGLRLNREGQLTDRFSKAIDQLGDERLDVRLGGIYALERIARDSERDHGPVMEVLTAYVRRYRRTESDARTRAPYDVQAIVSVLGRRNVSHDPPGGELDLSGADLRGVNITNAHLPGAFLIGVDLTGAAISNSNLEDVWLSNAKAGAFFVKTSLARAQLWGADFTGATFLDTRLDGAEYNEATKSPGADLGALGAKPPWRAPTLRGEDDLGS